MESIQIGAGGNPRQIRQRGKVGDLNVVSVSKKEERVSDTLKTML